MCHPHQSDDAADEIVSTAFALNEFGLLAKIEHNVPGMARCMVMMND